MTHKGDLQKSYWDAKIKDWVMSSYQDKAEGVSYVERIAARFRPPIRTRLATALQLVGPIAREKVILDLGCGLGNFCFEILRYQPQKVIGVDISSVALSEAGRICQGRGSCDKVEFIQGDITALDSLPQADVVVGLGVIDYLNKDQAKALFQKLDIPYFLFSFTEKRLSVLNFLHFIYLKSQHCPGYFKYSRKEIHSLIPRRFSPHFYEHDRVLFVTNLPGMRERLLYE